VRHPLYGFILATATVAAAISLATVPVAGQRRQAPPAPATSACPDDTPAAFHACATEAAKRFDPPRTSARHPDFSGIWRRMARAHEDLHEHPRTQDDTGGPSVIVAPADGLVPMQPWAEAHRQEIVSKYLHHNAACFLSGVPLTMFMTGQFQFLQTPTHFVVLSEESHAFRSVPFDGRPHIDSDITLWQGDSIGRWEGNTLVIDTTNQNARVFLDQRGRFYTDEARVEERLALVEADTLHYQATVDDPNVYTRPFTIAFAYRRNTEPGVELWEEACYEGNALSMEHFLTRFEIYPGITAEQARELRRAWEAREGAR